MSSPRSQTRAVFLLVLAYVGFVSLGLPDGLLGSAWPAIRAEWGLPLDAAGPALLLSTVGTVLSSLASGRLLARFGTGVVVFASAALAGLVLIVDALAPAWWVMVAVALANGMSAGAVDSSMNGFVARHYSARHMNWLHACWGIGATLGPLATAAALGSGASWRVAYGAFGVAELLLAATFFATLPLWGAAERTDHPHAPASRPEASAHLQPAMRASVAMFFVYCGIEVGAGLWGASLLVETRGASAALAGAAMAGYWGALTGGRFLIGALAHRFGHERLLRFGFTGALASALALSVPGAPVWLAVLALGALGFSIAPIYPTLMHDTPRRFGSAAAVRLVGYQVAAASVGIASLPWLLGIAARHGSMLLIAPGLAAFAAALLALGRVRHRGATETG